MAQKISVTLKVDAEDLRQKAGTVSGAVQNMEQEFRNLQRIVEGTSYYWKSGGADSYRRLYEQKVEKIQKLMAQMESYPVRIQKMAGVYEGNENSIVSGIQSDLKDSDLGLL